MVFIDRLMGVFKKERGDFRLAGAKGAAGFNVTAAIANKLANIVCAEAEMGIDGGGAVAEGLERFSRELRSVVARVFGTGGVVLRPYVRNGAVYTDVAAQERYFVIERCGQEVLKAGFIADVRGERVRVELHTLPGAASGRGKYVIENKAYEGEREVPLSSVDEWADIEPRTELAGVDTPLFAHLRCPLEAWDGGDGVYGVPITYGQEWLIKAIKELLEEIPYEYRNKRAFIGAEDLLFDADDRLPETGLYKLLRGTGSDNNSFWEVFSPEIRHTSYFEGLDYLFGLLEKAVSVNKGILTDLDSSDATATAIRRSMFDTYNLVNAMRKNIERAAETLVAAYGVLLAEGAPERAHAAPRRNADGREATGICREANVLDPGASGGAGFGLRFSWSYALLEDTSETFTQLIEAYDRGIVTKEEVRGFLF